MALILVLVLSGCGAANGENTQQTDSKPNSVESETTPSIIPTSESGKASEHSDNKDEDPENSTDSNQDPSIPSEPEGTAANEELDDAKKNSIAMLNYLAVLSQEINSSKNSRMFLEEAYAALINNTNPEKVNELTESHLASLLDIIEKYRLIAVKRDRLQYIYEQNKALALKEAVPNPIGLLSAVTSFDFKRMAASAIYMAVDSYSSYKAYNAGVDLQYLQDGWELDDEEAENVHDSRKRAFMFMIDIVREEQLPGELALNESSVEEYVKWKNNTNTDQKIQFFESQESTYEAFGDYWLTLASCYYEHEDYEKCLACFDKYEEIQADIFRKDYNLAKVLPLAIVAAKEVYSKDEYVAVAEKYLKNLIDNTENSEWSLKYFASQMYMDLYAQTNNESYLDIAFNITLNNVNYLVAEQKVLNATYLSDVKEVALPADPTKDVSKDEKASIEEEKKKIKVYNQALKDKRKVELPPAYEPLVLNCELLFGLVEERGVSELEKTRIEGILHQDGADLFLTETLDNRYTFSPEAIKVDAQYKKDALTIPATCVSETSFIRVTITEDGIDSVYEDWVVKKVERKSDNIESFSATFTSKECGEQKWSADSLVKVEIFNDKDTDKEPYVLQFRVSQYRKIPVLSDIVEFEQVR